MKNYLNYNIGDQVEITRSHSDDKGKIGTIIEVRHSFCKIQIDNTIKNYTYGQFKKVK